MGTDNSESRREPPRSDGPQGEGEWLNKSEFIRFLTRLAQGYPPKSRPRQFIEEYIDDLRENE